MTRPREASTTARGGCPRRATMVPTTTDIGGVGERRPTTTAAGGGDDGAARSMSMGRLPMTPRHPPAPVVTGMQWGGRTPPTVVRPPSTRAAHRSAQFALAHDVQG
jgi:hypothetical protein